jgi:hypothetical protein
MRRWHGVKSFKKIISGWGKKTKPFKEYVKMEKVAGQIANLGSEKHGLQG